MDEDADEAACRFHPSTVEKLWKGRFEKEDTKVSKDALKVAAELLRIFVEEAVARSVEQVPQTIFVSIACLMFLETCEHAY